MKKMLKNRHYATSIVPWLVAIGISAYLGLYITAIILVPLYVLWIASWGFFKRV